MSMNSCAIMQPTYLPWSGYFNLIKNVDIFVFLDDVQFDRRSWQTRNRINQGGRDLLLSISTNKTTQNEFIKNISLNDNNNWRLKHTKSLESAYAKAQYGDRMLRLILPIINNNQIKNLSIFNQEIIIAISRDIGLNTKFIKSSSLPVSEKRSKYLAKICDHLNIANYLSPVGSKEYLESDNFDALCKAKLHFQNFVAKEYRQRRTKTFISHLSIVDVIANLGNDKTLEYITSGLDY